MPYLLAQQSRRSMPVHLLARRIWGADRERLAISAWISGLMKWKPRGRPGAACSLPQALFRLLEDRLGEFENGVSFGFDSAKNERHWPGLSYIESGAGA